MRVVLLAVHRWWQSLQDLCAKPAQVPACDMQLEAAMTASTSSEPITAASALLAIALQVHILASIINCQK